MAFDFALDTRRDMAASFVTGAQETMQRLATRLQRELGEWFLDETAGLPWLGVNGLLGTKDTRAIDLLIRRETLGTEGVSRILKYSSLLNPTDRQYTIHMQVLLAGGEPVNLTLTEEGAKWHTA